MARHMSNSERIARAAAEVAATDKEKAEKKAAAPAKKRASKARAPKEPVRMKIVWGVGPPLGEPVKVFPYLAKAEAEAEAARLGKGNLVKALKVPME
jgi:hypothetical protein